MSDFKRSEIEPKVWIREPQDFCPACGDDRTGKGSLIAAPIGQAFCNELCLMKWQQSRIAELERHNELLRAVAIQTGYRYNGFRGMDKGMKDALQAAIDGGAMSSQWDKATEELLEERRDLWQRLADSDSGAIDNETHQEAT